MSWLTRRSLVLFAASIVIGAISVLIWPGDLNNEPMTGAHWAAVVGFLLTATLLFMAAVAVFLNVMRSAWNVNKFDLDEYLDDMKKNK